MPARLIHAARMPIALASSDVGIDPVIGFQTRLTVMVLGLLGTFYVLALVCWLPGAILALRLSGDRAMRGSTAAE